MWKIFNRKTGRISIVHALFERCSGKIEGIQRRFADYLNTKMSSWSAFRVKVVLIAFIFCYVAVTALMLLSASSSSDNRLLIQPIYQPRNVIIPDQGGGSEGSVYISDRLRQFQSYLDSLKKDEGGRRVYDSILLTRPGLIDSLTKLETLENRK